MTTDTITLAVGDIEFKRSLHEALAAALGIPDWCGKNWDAFEESIREPSQSTMPRRLIITGFGALRARLPREADLLQRCLRDREAVGPDFEVVFQDE
jgi:barstar (barnase inhibitor)